MYLFLWFFSFLNLARCTLLALVPVGPLQVNSRKCRLTSAAWSNLRKRVRKQITSQTDILVGSSLVWQPASQPADCLLLNGDHSTFLNLRDLFSEKVISRITPGVDDLQRRHC
ncbi:predicted protein [Histoplasma capsulatum G186AR]|uniref:Secreted protein n=1 Tax=Ajellomyces capsulatus (strain G186AR / H82 / ATCC MYA-2454 / RMSCC 2432) TaxID=447093 RepID=C0NP27_AJECG|nr:uncharacterized protein HCBG_04907 [Histoplasma capsulatum G186AR]EEH06687.1 predicted protein [Histoplasma capsulatum G186AR]